MFSRPMARLLPLLPAVVLTMSSPMMIACKADTTADCTDMSIEFLKILGIERRPENTLRLADALDRLPPDGSGYRNWAKAIVLKAAEEMDDKPLYDFMRLDTHPAEEKTPAGRLLTEVTLESVSP